MFSYASSMFGSTDVLEEKTDPELMVSLTTLIKKKCNINDVKISGMSIILNDNAFVAGKRQNQVAVDLLVAAGAKSETVHTEGLK